MRTRTFLLLVGLLLVLCAVASSLAGQAAPLTAPRLSLTGLSANTLRGRLTRPLTAEHIGAAGGDAALCRLGSASLLVGEDGACRFLLTPSTRWTRA